MVAVERVITLIPFLTRRGRYNAFPYRETDLPGGPPCTCGCRLTGETSLRRTCRPIGAWVALPPPPPPPPPTPPLPARPAETSSLQLVGRK